MHEDDKDKTVQVDYEGLGHYNWAEHINDLQQANAVMRDYAVGDILLSSSNAVVDIDTYLTPTKTKEISIIRYGTLRIKFTLLGLGYTTYGRIYRNGVAIGTEQSTLNAGWVIFSEDISGWSSDDLCQLYCWVASSSIGEKEVKDFQIYISFEKYPEETVNL